MIKIEKTEVVGWKHAIRGMRNPKNSWDRMDTGYCEDFETCVACPNINEDGKCGIRHYENMPPIVGPNDHKLMMQLANGGPVHAKYRRMIAVYVDITAPLYWWKEFDTYKVGTVANSCSTMHKLPDKEFTLEDFSCEYLLDCESVSEDQFMSNDPMWCGYRATPHDMLSFTVKMLNFWREQYLKNPSKISWLQMIQLLPSSYNQKRTVMLNYEVLVGMYRDRKNHKLDEWHDFCDWIESLPYREIICGPGYLRKKMNIPADAEGAYKEAIEAMSNEKEEK